MSVERWKNESWILDAFDKLYAPENVAFLNRAITPSYVLLGMPNQKRKLIVQVSSIAQGISKTMPEAMEVHAFVHLDADMPQIITIEIAVAASAIVTRVWLDFRKEPFLICRHLALVKLQDTKLYEHRVNWDYALTPLIL